MNRFENTAFARLYLWTAKAKYTMGILYLAFSLFYLFMGYISPSAVTLDLFTALQMMFACFFIGIAQQAIVPQNNLTKYRSILWVATGMLIILLFNMIFKWFSPFPAWSFVVFVAVSAMGMIALLLSHYIELHRETQTLNRQLEKFQRQTPQQ